MILMRLSSKLFLFRTRRVYFNHEILSPKVLHSLRPAYHNWDIHSGLEKIWQLEITNGQNFILKLDRYLFNLSLHQPFVLSQDSFYEI